MDQDPLGGSDDALAAALEAKSLIGDMHKLQQDMCTALDSMMKVQQEMWTGLASIAGGVDRLAMACEELLQSQPEPAAAAPPSGSGTNDFFGSAPAPREVTNITIVYETGWEETFLHYNADGKGWTEVPGEKMQRGSGEFASAQMHVVDAKRVEFVANNGGDNWDKPGDGSEHYVIDEPGIYCVKLGKVERMEL